MEGSSLLYVTTLPGLVAVGIVILKIITWPCVQRVVWFNGLKSLIVSNHFAKLYGPRPCSSSDTTTEVVYVTFQYHVIKGSGDFVEGNTSLYILTLPKLIAIGILLMDIQLF